MGGLVSARLVPDNQKSIWSGDCQSIKIQERASEARAGEGALPARGFHVTDKHVTSQLTSI